MNHRVIGAVDRTYLEYLVAAVRCEQDRLRWAIREAYSAGLDAGQDSPKSVPPSTLASIEVGYASLQD